MNCPDCEEELCAACGECPECDHEPCEECGLCVGECECE